MNTDFYQSPAKCDKGHMTAVAHEGQGEDRWKEAAFLRENTCRKTEACLVEEGQAHDTALKAKIEVKLDPEAGLHAALEHHSGPCLDRCGGQC